MEAVETPRRQLLLAAKLRALVRATEPGVVLTDDAVPRVPIGAAGVLTKAGDAWFLAEDGAARLLGSALVWLGRAAPIDVARHHVIVAADDAVSITANRLSLFTRRPRLYRVDGATTEAVAIPTHEAAIAAAGPPLRFDPVAFVAELPLSTRAAVRGLLDAVEAIDALTVERDQHSVHFTVRGLEVARFEFTGDDAFLAVGVGKFDRAARRELAGEQPLAADDLGPAVATLRAAVTAVLERRRADAPEHQIRSLRKERWLRARVMADPTLAGLPAALNLEPVAPPVQPPDLVARNAAPAIGDDEVVVCSTGIDLDLVPTAAHAWLQAAHERGDASEPRLTIVVPEADDHPVTRTLLEALMPRLRARVASVPANWMSD
jgi:hypothetical protein